MTTGVQYSLQGMRVVNGEFPVEIVDADTVPTPGKYGDYIIIRFKIPGQVLEDGEDLFFSRPFSVPEKGKAIRPNMYLGRLIAAISGGKYNEGSTVSLSDLPGKWFQAVIVQEDDGQFVQTKIVTFKPLDAKYAHLLEVDKDKTPF